MMKLSAPGSFFQLGYVTADLAVAKDLFRMRHGVTGFLEFDTAGHAPPGTFGIKVALGYSRGVMVELIEPDVRSPGIYGDAMNSDRLATLHHLGFLVDQAAFDAHEAELAAEGISVPVINRQNGMCLLYADTRAGDGLFTELVVSTEATRALFSNIPPEPPI